MRLDVLLLPCELPARVRPETTAVVIDVIRATTTIVTAFQHGCRSVLPVGSPAEAQLAKSAKPASILAGEKGGKRIAGFDLGNSPREFTREAAAGRDIILSTSNGTKALRAVGPGRRVAIGTLRNRAAVGRWLAAQGEDALIVCSGYEETFSLEDAVCAGGIVDAAAVQDGAPALGDGALACRILWREHAADLPRLLRESAWGRHILAIGLGPDLELCAQCDVTDVVPVMTEGRIAIPAPRA
jgi:2-phosphosulfolactate phosphatase